MAARRSSLSRRKSKIGSGSLIRKRSGQKRSGQRHHHHANTEEYLEDQEQSESLEYALQWEALQEEFNGVSDRLEKMMRAYEIESHDLDQKIAIMSRLRGNYSFQDLVTNAKFRMNDIVRKTMAVTKESTSLLQDIDGSMSGAEQDIVLLNGTPTNLGIVEQSITSNFDETKLISHRVGRLKRAHDSIKGNAVETLKTNMNEVRDVFHLMSDEVYDMKNAKNKDPNTILNPTTRQVVTLRKKLEEEKLTSQIMKRKNDRLMRKLEDIQAGYEKKIEKSKRDLYLVRKNLTHSETTIRKIEQKNRVLNMFNNAKKIKDMTRLKKQLDVLKENYTLNLDRLKVADADLELAKEKVAESVKHTKDLEAQNESLLQKLEEYEEKSKSTVSVQEHFASRLELQEARKQLLEQRNEMENMANKNVQLEQQVVDLQKSRLEENKDKNRRKRDQRRKTNAMKKMFDEADAEVRRKSGLLIQKTEELETVKHKYEEIIRREREKFTHLEHDLKRANSRLSEKCSELDLYRTKLQSTKAELGVVMMERDEEREKRESLVLPSGNLSGMDVSESSSSSSSSSNVESTTEPTETSSSVTSSLPITTTSVTSSPTPATPVTPSPTPATSLPIDTTTTTSSPTAVTTTTTTSSPTNSSGKMTPSAKMMQARYQALEKEYDKHVRALNTMARNTVTAVSAFQDLIDHFGKGAFRSAQCFLKSSPAISKVIDEAESQVASKLEQETSRVLQYTKENELEQAAIDRAIIDGESNDGTFIWNHLSDKATHLRVFTWLQIFPTLLKRLELLERAASSSSSSLLSLSSKSKDSNNIEVTKSSNVEKRDIDDVENKKIDDVDVKKRDIDFENKNIDDVDVKKKDIDFENKKIDDVDVKKRDIDFEKRKSNDVEKRKTDEEVEKIKSINKKASVKKKTTLTSPTSSHHNKPSFTPTQEEQLQDTIHITHVETPRDRKVNTVLIPAPKPTTALVLGTSMLSQKSERTQSYYNFSELLRTFMICVINDLEDKKLVSSVYNMAKEFVQENTESEMKDMFNEKRREEWKSIIRERLEDVKRDPFQTATHSILSFLEIRAVQRRERSTEWKKRYDIACRRNMEYKNQIVTYESKLSRLNHAIVLLERLNADIMKSCRAVSRRQKASLVDLNQQLGLLRGIMSNIPSFLYSNNKKNNVSPKVDRREIPKLLEQQRRLRLNKFEASCAESRMTLKVPGEEEEDDDDDDKQLSPSKSSLKLPDLIHAEDKHRLMAREYIQKKQILYQNRISSRLKNLSKVIGNNNS